MRPSRMTLLLTLLVGAVFSAPAALAAPADSGSAPRILQGGCTGDADCDRFPDSSDPCPTGYGTVNGCPDPDTDGDGVPDSQDACPTVNKNPFSAGGCPDFDGDGLADKDDACPKRSGPAASGGCGDSDRDGKTDDVDPCPNEGNNPRYPKRKVQPDGCWPTFVEVGYFASNIKYLAQDVGGILTADCDFHHEQTCAVRVMMTLSANTAKALGLKNPRITDRKIALTTKAEKEAAHPRQPLCGCRPARQGTLDLGLSASLRNRIAKLRSVTMTMRVTYTVGSEEPQSMTKVYKLGRKATDGPPGSNRLSNIPGFNDEAEDDMSNLDDPDGR
jgi:hypothetical protein